MTGGHAGPVIDAAGLLTFVDDALAAMIDTLESLGDEEANRRPPLAGANSPYAIVNHCLGVLAYWGGAIIAGRVIQRDRDAEFRASGPVAELIERARVARVQLDVDLAGFDGLAAPRGEPEPADRLLPLGRTQGGALVHIYEELAQHRGQLDITRDLLTQPRPGGFAVAVDSEIDLVLRESWTWPIMHELTRDNIDHLKPWEPWASDFPDYDAFADRCRRQLAAFAEGTDVPTAIRYRGRLVGSVGARPEAYFNTANIGYWLDASQMGRGIATRAVGGLIDYLFTVRGVARVELQTAVGNDPSRALAERLGFQFEGIRRSAAAIAGRRRDDAVYGLLPTDWSPSGAR